MNAVRTTTPIASTRPALGRQWRNWQLYMAASLFAIACAALLDSIIFLHWPFGLAMAPPQLPEGGTALLLGAIAVQPIALLGRIVLVALTLQAVLLASGSMVRFRLLFRAATMASFVSLCGLALALVPIWRYRDLAHMSLVPGSFAMLMQVQSVAWNAVLGQISAIDLLWGAVLYSRLSAYTGVARGRLLLAIGTTWCLAFLLALVMRLLPLYLGLAPG